MNQGRSITGLAHAAVRPLVRPGDVVIDATAGNGHDTRFLADLVGPTGIVYAFDIQPDALRSARARCREVASRIRWFADSHAHLDASLAPSHRGQVAAVLFNLGYLPGGDKRIATLAESTGIALRVSLPLLRAGGILSIVVYPGHEQGRAEARAVETWLARLDPTVAAVQVVRTAAANSEAPFLVTIRRNLPDDSA